MASSEQPIRRGDDTAELRARYNQLCAALTMNAGTNAAAAERVLQELQTLAQKIALFRSQGQLVREGDELFVEIGWFQVLTGQNIVPRGYHPMVDRLSREELSGFFGDIETIVAGAASRLPTHDDFIAQHCAAGVPA